jgi:hypothetical protein
MMVAAVVLLGVLVLVFLFAGLVLLIWGVGMRFVMFGWAFCCPKEKVLRP